MKSRKERREENNKFIVDQANMLTSTSLSHGITIDVLAYIYQLGVVEGTNRGIESFTREAS